MIGEMLRTTEEPAIAISPQQAAQQDAQAWRVTRQPGPTSYYRYPLLKKPGWSWEIPAYFFTGGLAAGSYLIATLADLFGTKEDRAVSRAGRYMSLIALIVSPLLLILDLGRPRRFAHMLRVFKVRSPMNLGTWGLVGFSVFAVLGVLRQWVEDGILSRGSIVARVLGWVPLQVSGILGSLFAFFVGSYTGVLLSFTNAPIWAKNRLLQGPLFLTSALSTGLSAISLALTLTGSSNPHSEKWMKQAENAATMGEMAATAGTLATVGSLGRPLLASRAAIGFWPGAVGLGLVLPMMLRRAERMAPGEARHTLRIASNVSTLLGGLIFRWVDARVGRPSIEDPDYYFTFTKPRP
ncbi:MAG: polysulfide reductase NrfD [Chloroflexi bacterium]|nr:polysulfide reductase NrfD [Chloroflexota bacterium]